MYFLTVAEFEGQVSVHTDSYGITEQPTLEDCASPQGSIPCGFGGHLAPSLDQPTTLCQALVTLTA